LLLSPLSAAMSLLRRPPCSQGLTAVAWVGMGAVLLLQHSFEKNHLGPRDVNNISWALFDVLSSGPSSRPRSLFVVHRPLFIVHCLLFVVRHLLFVVCHSPFVIRRSPSAASTHDPPHKQWLAGLRWVLGHLSLSLLSATMLLLRCPPCSQRLAVVVWVGVGALVAPFHCYNIIRT
jgi:hypothetical protein